MQGTKSAVGYHNVNDPGIMIYDPKRVLPAVLERVRLPLLPYRLYHRQILYSTATFPLVMCDDNPLGLLIPRHLGYNISLRVYYERAMKPSVYPPYHPRSL
jgi:hypothetical protein